MEPAKKISFGFSKINKKVNLSANKPVQKPEVELIKCLEGQEIKLVEEKKEEAPLVIPLKGAHKTSSALASLMKRRAVLLGEDEPNDVDKQNENKETPIEENGNEPEDLEKRAAKELLAEINANGSLDTDKNLTLPVVHPNDLPLEGAKESSMDDYENIPIQDFGKALLRGMGWVEPPKPTKGGPPVDDMPMVRPKGMGLGADKALKAKPLLVAPESNEVLEIKRHAYVRILGGKHKDLYGQIEGFDDHAGRVIVKMAIGGAKEAFNEFLCQPVSRKEYAQYGKCINSTKYEEYKRKENEFGQIVIKEEKNDIRKPKDDNKNNSKDVQNGKEVHEISSDEDDQRNSRKIKEERSERRDYDDRKDRRNVKDEPVERERKNIKYEKEENSKGDYDERRDRKDTREEPLRRSDDRRKDRRDKDEYNKSDNKSTRNNYNDRNNYRDRDDSKGRDRERDNRNDKYRDVDESKYNRREDKYENKDRDSRKDNHRDDDRRRENERDYRRDDEKYKKREVERYKDERYDNDDRNYRNDGDRKTENLSREKQKDYEERSRRKNSKSSNDSDSSDSEEEYRKNKKSNKKKKKSDKKSKKSKKSKSRHHESSSDSEDSSSSDSSDSEEERSKKKHKSKNKKSKKQRERSRSRGRR
ncbi:peptidyl-prolyl cis-trans isomerase G [Musca vetustissima]|uniref:peptidyl-prolyl cis-trans isomerase G n=1 Tax=Musca vetustissima TaxID=27455 RepID=UPI002AB67D66|nr:peptidyl-prolyl cis-trans isomerase G [Musca vetustissima]